MRYSLGYLLTALLLSFDSSPAADLDLSTLDLSAMSSGWGTPQANRSITGRPLSIGATRFERGIGTHAPSEFMLRLDGKATRFRAKVGVDAATEGRGSVVFEVYLDGKRTWKSPVMSGLDKARDLKVDVSGVDRLRLVVTDGGDGNRLDAADWCDPVLVP